MSRVRRFLRRPLLLFALLLLGPALGFCVLGWNSVRQEHEFRKRDAARAAQDVVTRRVDEAADALERLRIQETSRHYYEYQSRYLPQQIAFQQLAFQDNVLVGPGSDARIVGRFQWELGPQGVWSAPEVLAEDPSAVRAALVDVYGLALSEHLETAPTHLELRTGRAVDYPLRVVQANEEVGQLIEELDVQEREREAGGARNVAESPYLTSFQQRAGSEPLTVRYSPFRYLAAPLGAPAPPLVAWRMVWIPAEHTSRREVQRDRWFLQGYLLSPVSLPSGWTNEGDVEIALAETVSPLPEGEVFEASLAEALRAQVIGGGHESLGLVLLGRADEGRALQAYEDAMRRFLLLVAGLVVVVAVGFVVLMRGVRREIALARRKEDFIAAITHELKTPLTGIRMYADMLLQGWVSSPEAAEKYASRILTETDRLGNLVDQVLDLAALERGVADVNAIPGDLGEAVADATELMRSKADQAGVDLTVEIAPDLPTATFDAKLIRPLVLNLVDNAIKYSERAEHKEVHVSVELDGDRLVLRVADRGVGIPAEARKTLFEPFQRAGNEMTRSTTGVGIGLALVKRYADAHRARVLVESELGVGTTVTVRFQP